MVSRPGVAVSRATLRDSMNRLKSIRKRCGKEDEEDKAKASTGDPFRDRCNQFMSDLKECKELISERNEGARKNGQDRTTIEQSHDINRSILNLEKDLKEIKSLVEEAERTLAKENRKGKKAKQTKVVLYERQYKDRETAYKNCCELLEAAKAMNQQRFGGGGKKGGAGLTQAQELKLGKSAQLRSQLLATTRNGASANAGATSNVDGGGGGGDKDSLEKNPETAEQMKVLAQQEKLINAGLDRLSKGVARLHNLALEIGAEIDTQNTMLDQADDKVSSQTKQLKNLNKRLKKLVKETAPVSMLLNVGCFGLLLALVGYFLYEFGVI